MATKKKSAPAKTPSPAQAVIKPPSSKLATRPAPAPAKPTKAAPAPAAVKPVKAAAKPAKPAKPAVDAIQAAAKPAKVAKAAPPSGDAAPAPSTALDVGSAAPSFDLINEKGAKISSATLAGKPYLLYFYPKDDTPGCTKEACDIRDNFARFGKQGLTVLGVSPDSQQSHAKFGKKYGLPFTLLSDPDKKLANAYGVWGQKSNYGKQYLGIIRSSFLVGADGKIKKTYRGVNVNGHVDAVLADAQAVL